MNDNYLCPLRVVRIETTRTPPNSFYNWSRDCPNPDKYQTNIYVAYYKGLLPKRENPSLIVVSGLRTRHQSTVITIYAVDCEESTARKNDLGNSPYKK